MKKDFYILQIEDEKVLAEQAEYMIKENCPFVTRMKTVGTGEKGIEEIQKEMPDFIILNQYMPGITGLEMLERCHSLELKLPEVIVITGGLKTKREEDRFYELGVKYIASRILNDIQKRFIFYFIEESYKSSTKMKEEDMTELITRQTDILLRDIKEVPEPYSISLVGYVIRHLVINDLEYTKENKDELYECFKNENKLSNQTINEIREKIEMVIKFNYCQGNPIKKLNYEINKDTIEYEFFHKLKENVLKDIIAESN